MKPARSVKQALACASQLTTSDSPALDCQLLLAHLLHKNRTWLFARDDYLLTAFEWQVYQNLLLARQSGKPIAYLLGIQEFWSLAFKVNEHTLVPRADTELLVETILARRPDPAVAIADLGTGAGAIAIALASELPLADIIATDISAEALDIAGENSRRLCQGRVKFMLANWLTPFRDKHFDIIVSNPPYVAPDDPHLHSLAAEPIGALVAKDQGLADIKIIIGDARRCLKSGGYVLLEHGQGQQGQLRALLVECGYTGPQTLRDLSGQARAVLAYST